MAYRMENEEEIKSLGEDEMKMKRDKMNRIIKHCVHGRDDGRETLNLLQIKSNNNNYKDKCKISLTYVCLSVM